MALNRRQRRARKDRRPHAGDTPAQQMRDFLRAPGKVHIVQLPEEKSFIVKVTDREMPLFLTICQQLRAVLGHCEAIPATPVDASVADTQTIARQTASDPQRVADAQRRQDEADQERANQADADELAASMERHPAGKRRSGGRHAKPEPDNTFDKLAASEDRIRAASIELAAAQDASAKAQDQLDAANARLAEVYERTGDIHNQRVLNQFTDAAGQAIAEQAEQTENDGKQPYDPQWQMSGPGKFTIDDAPNGYSAPEVFAPRTDGNYTHQMHCSREECDWTGQHPNAADLARDYARHIAEHAQADDSNP